MRHERLDARTERLTFDPPLTIGEVIAQWQSASEFLEGWIDALRDAPFDAYFWETPCATTLDRAFECALVDAPGLARTSGDPSAFSRHFARAVDDVADFANLGGDAHLVVPTPHGTEDYASLAAFTRHAPLVQQHALWRRVGGAWHAAIEAGPVWLNTAGMGVPWLHVRLDASPKYYRHAPYRQRA